MDDDGGSRSSFGGAFRPYNRTTNDANLESNRLSVVVRRPLVARLTNDIVETFQLSNPHFKYSEVLNPKRFLTNPSVGVLNDGYDNANSDLILHVNTVLVNSTTNQRYYVKDLLGQGTFGQVAKCWVPESDSYVAVKVIKNHTAYYRQSLVEVSILMTLNQKLGHDEKRHIVRILDYFIYQRHLCISFEMLGSNLYELIKLNQYRGFPMSIVQVFSKQILHALVVIKEAGIIHCDLKPENILLSTSAKPEIKVIDFGSACREGHTVYSYIQSRYYRSPEVLLGFPYTTAIDMWSFGCIVAELFLGLPLFSGASEYDLLKRMIEILGSQPPDYLLGEAKETDKFFKHIASTYRLEEDGASKGTASPYQMLTEEEFETRVSQKPIIGKRYFSHVKLEDIITNYPCRKNLSEKEISKEKDSRKALVDFLKGLVEFDPGKRWSPLQASRHPFVTGEPFIYPFQPPQETPRIPVGHSVTVDHNPGGGHWLAAGLSPQVPSSNRCLPHNSPRFHMVPLPPYGSSFGSLGSHGSYNDNTGLGSSYGSYNDVNSMYSYFSPVAPCGLNIQTQVGGPFLGASPDTRRRPHMSHGNGFGVSPAGSLGPMSLGASPSQFTPPSSQMQIPTVSPGKYGPTSPARGSVHLSPFGKGGAAGHGQYSRRRSWGYFGASSMQPHENASQHWQGYHGDGISCQSDAIGRGHVGSPRSTLSASNHSNWRQQPSSSSQTVPVSSTFNANAVSYSTEVSCDKHEGDSSLPDPADWDPNYSDELLLQEDNSEVNSLAIGIANNISLGNAINIFVPSETGKPGQGHRQARTNANFVSSNQRTDGLFQAYSLAEGSPHFTHDTHAGHSRLPPFSQNTPTRFGQQSAHRHNQNSTYMRGEGIYHIGQPARGHFAVADLPSAAHNMMGNCVSWGHALDVDLGERLGSVKYTGNGRRGGHPIATTLPSSHTRKDHGRLS